MRGGRVAGPQSAHRRCSGRGVGAGRHRSRQRGHRQLERGMGRRLGAGRPHPGGAPPLCAGAPPPPSSPICDPTSCMILTVATARGLLHEVADAKTVTSSGAIPDAPGGACRALVRRGALQWRKGAYVTCGRRKSGRNTCDGLLPLRRAPRGTRPTSWLRRCPATGHAGAPPPFLPASLPWAPPRHGLHVTAALDVDSCAAAAAAAAAATTRAAAAAAVVERWSRAKGGAVAGCTA